MTDAASEPNKSADQGYDSGSISSGGSRPGSADGRSSIGSPAASDLQQIVVSATPSTTQPALSTAKDVELSAGIAALRRRAGHAPTQPGVRTVSTVRPPASNGKVFVATAQNDPLIPTLHPVSIVRAAGDIRSAAAKLRVLYTLACEVGDEDDAAGNRDPSLRSPVEPFMRTFRVIRNRNEVYSLVCNALATWNRPPGGVRADQPGDGDGSEATARSGGDKLWKSSFGGG